MGIIDAAMRKRIPTSEFGLPAQRKYPVTDPGHAIAAKAYASKEAKRGVISPSQKAQIDAKANAKLGKK